MGSVGARLSSAASCCLTFHVRTIVMNLCCQLSCILNFQCSNIFPYQDNNLIIFDSWQAITMWCHLTSTIFRVLCGHFNSIHRLVIVFLYWWTNQSIFDFDKREIFMSKHTQKSTHGRSVNSSLVLEVENLIIFSAEWFSSTVFMCCRVALCLTRCELDL